MKKKVLIIIMMIYISSLSFAQNKIDPQVLLLGWKLTSPLILDKVKDKLTKEIVTNAIPKIIDQDVKGAVLEVTNAIYNVKKIKVLNKDFLLIIEKNVNDGIKAIKKNDYSTAVNLLATVVLVSEEYLNKGILNIEKPSTTIPKETIAEKKVEAVSSKEVNSKFHIGKNNTYLFYSSKGNFTEKDETFKFTDENNKEFIFVVNQTHSQNLRELNIKTFQSDKNKLEKLKSLILTNLSKDFDNGIYLHSKVAEYPNFKALRFDYTFTNKTTSESITSYVNIVFNDTTMFLIFFGSNSNDFLETSKSFEELMHSFYIIGLDEISNNSNINENTNTATVSQTNTDNSIKESSPCQSKNMGVLTIVNKSTNPYIIYKNGNYLMTINAKEIKQNILVELGTTNFKADQKSGYAVYPTVNKRPVKFTSACEEQTINIGFSDK